MFRKIFFLVIFILIVQVSFCQSSKEIRAMENEAGRSFLEDEHSYCLPIYLMLDSLKPGNPEFIARIGISYLFLPSKYKALSYLERAQAMNYSKDGLLYYLGRAYHLKHNFDKAIEMYSLYKVSLIKSVIKSKDKIKEADDLIAQCKIGKELVLKPVQATIHNAGISVNSPYSDFAPVISADEKTLIFTSKRPNSGRKDEEGNFYEDIYISTKKDTSWSKPENIGVPVNTKVNDASIGLSLDGEQLFVYKNDTSDLDQSGGDIFESDLRSGKWTRPRRLNKNVNSNHWEPSASLISDESILFFSSDRPGGYGGTDIYLSRKLKNNTWGPAKNLGPLINTAYNEDAPFIHPDSKTLYFSSNGPKSMGGFDIFTVFYNKITDSVSTPVNIGFPVNTADDELFFVWSADGKRGYFSASREDGYGEEDIYIVNRPNINIDLVLLSGKIKSQDKTVKVSIKLIDNATNEIVAVYDSTKFYENYTILLEPGKNYTLAIESNKHLSHSENIIAPIHGFVKIEKDIEMHPLEKGGAVALNNIFFNKGSVEPRKESFHELDRYYDELISKKNLIIEIGNHSSDLGNDHVGNFKLSTKRAEVLANYFVEKGMERGRIKAFGYGDKFKLIKGDSVHNTSLNTRTDLIIAHNLQNGPLSETYKGHYNEKENLEDIPEQNIPVNTRKKSPSKDVYNTISTGGEIIHPANATEEEKRKIIQNFIRRKVKEGKLMPVVLQGNIFELASSQPLSANIEVTDNYGALISKIRTSKDGKYEIEVFQERETPCRISVKKNGYTYHLEFISLPANTPEKVSIVKNIYLKELTVGMSLNLKNIYYDQNKSTLRSDSHAELEALEKLLKTNRSMCIEIAGHTDSKGPDYYNKVLSQHRAEAVVTYLVNKGIAKKRLTAIGYGEEKPLASNDDEAEGREINRRTELHVRKK